MTPKRLAYMLREGLHAARFHDDFARLYEVKPFYRFLTGPDFVVAVWAGLGTPVSRPRSAEPVAFEQPTVEIRGRLKLVDVIGSALDNTDAIELYYPDVSLDPAEMMQLFTWAASRPWSLIDNLDLGITLTKHEVEPEMLWRPSKEVRDEV